MGELANCPQCGELFVKGTISVCHKCYQEEEDKFDRVYAFIRKKRNRTATIYEVSIATEVEESLITKWLKQKRIHPTLAPNLNYPCEKCGNPISEGKLCSNCSDSFRKSLTEESRAQQVKETSNHMTYYNVNKEK